MSLLPYGRRWLARRFQRLSARSSLRLALSARFGLAASAFSISASVFLAEVLKACEAGVLTS